MSCGAAGRTLPGFTKANFAAVFGVVASILRPDLLRVLAD
jgi:hypothetical protein